MPEKINEKQVRRRLSYKQFAELLTVIHRANPEETLRAVYDTMDKMMAFGSSTVARFAQQSIEQVLKDDLVLARRRLASAVKNAEETLTDALDDTSVLANDREEIARLRGDVAKAKNELAEFDA